MRRSLNSRLYTIRLCLRHPEIALARWRGRGLEPLDAVCVEYAGPGAPPPILSPELFRRLARLTFPYARRVFFAGRSDPLLHAGLRGMLLSARSYGKEVCVVTNGLLLDEGAVCALVAAGTDRLVVLPVSGETPEASRVSKNLDTFGKVLRGLGASRPVLDLPPPGTWRLPPRRIWIDWDGTVHGPDRPGAAAPAEPLGELAALTPRDFLSPRPGV